jgi:B12-binding domain/radical SAM domain protein of rhizo-twelve system
MRVALVNPPWRFEGSIYFGCREPHLALEHAYARALLREAGHDARLFDAHLSGQDLAALRGDVAAFAPELTVVGTAPTYLFWRCAPPELRWPALVVRALRDVSERVVAVGPHASATPAAALRKLGVDAAILGECEDVLPALAARPFERWGDVPSVVRLHGDRLVGDARRHATDLAALPPLAWEPAELTGHRHHHHRFDVPPDGPGAEIEASRGCPYHCTFCAKDEFRDRFRKRPLDVVLAELDALVAAGARYAYFIDEIFVPDRPLLDALAQRGVPFGVQMRVDQWSKDDLDRLGAAGCVSIEAGVESVTAAGRSLLAKRCKRSTAELAELLLHAKRRVAFVQANLLDSACDAPEDVAAFRARLRDGGVWSNDPVPMFRYPGSPSYVERWGPPDDRAWERALDAYLAETTRLSDLQDAAPLPLGALEDLDLG